MSRKKETPVLIHPPVVEVIFELRWQIESDEKSGRMRDPSYPMMFGRMCERFKQDFPHGEDLPSVQAHPETTPFIPRHRMRKEPNGYPLVQVGPGILTLNDGKKSSWTHFKTTAVQLVEAVSEMFPKNSMPLHFIKAELRYVNGVQFDLARENPLAFLADKLHIKIEVDPELEAALPIGERPNQVGLNLAYVLDKPMGHLGISANLGHVDGKPAFIQQTVIQSFGELTPTEGAGFSSWLEEAHRAAEGCFQVFCKGALMDRFCGTCQNC